MAVFEKGNVFYMLDSASISYNTFPDKRVYTPEHKHDFIEFSYVVRGKTIHIIDEVEHSARRGDMVIVNYDQTHIMDAEPGIVYFDIFLKPEYINKNYMDHENAFTLLNLSEFEDFREILDKSKTKIHFQENERQMLEDVLFQIHNEIEGRKPGYELTVKSYFNILLVMVFRKMSLNMDNSFNSLSDELLNYIKINCIRKISLADISRQCGYNSEYFSRLFKQYTGMTFSQYLKNARIERAIELILNTNMSIESIVGELGYSNKTRFYRQFKDVTGVTPYNYRKTHKV